MRLIMSHHIVLVFTTFGWERPLDLLPNEDGRGLASGGILRESRADCIVGSFRRVRWRVSKLEAGFCLVRLKMISRCRRILTVFGSLSAPATKAVIC